VQTLYYLGPAGTGRRKRTATAAAQRGSQDAGGEAGATEDTAVEPETAPGRKGGKRNKRRKKGAAVAGKENSAPEEEEVARQKSGSPSPEEQEVRMCVRCQAACELPKPTSAQAC
jgi:hypothetical protein